MRVPVAARDPASFLVGVFDGHGRNGEIVSAFCKVKIVTLCHV
jgi:serine/threonine protein phosphatase PrpC